MDLYLAAELRELREQLLDWRDAPAAVDADLPATEAVDARCADAQWQLI